MPIILITAHSITAAEQSSVHHCLLRNLKLCGGSFLKIHRSQTKTAAPAHAYLCFSVCLFLCLSVCLFHCLSVSVYVSVYLSVLFFLIFPCHFSFVRHPCPRFPILFIGILITFRSPCTIAFYPPTAIFVPFPTPIIIFFLVLLWKNRKTPSPKPLSLPPLLPPHRQVALMTCLSGRLGRKDGPAPLTSAPDKLPNSSTSLV